MAFVELNGAKCYYEKNGAGKTTLLFLHGLFFDGRMFEKIIENLGDDYTCIALDWRAQGRSEIVDFGLDADALVYDLKQLLEYLEIDKCTIIGVSVGGAIALRFAAQFPNRVEKIIGIGSNAQCEEIETLARYEEIMAGYEKFGAIKVIDRLSNLIFGPDFNSNPARKQDFDFWQKHILENNHKSVAMAAAPILRRRDISSMLKRIEAKTLLIVGEFDFVNNIEKSKHIVSHLPHGKIAIMPNTGHSPPVENPIELSRLIKDFIR